MSAKAYEGGIRPYRLEFVRESTEGEAPSNPTWELFSDNARTFDPTIEPGTEGQRGLGSVDPVDHFTGTGSYSFTVEYDLQQWLIDGSSSPQDAAYDGMTRDSDNTLVNSHTVVRRMEQDSLDAGNTVNGSTSKDTRQYVVYKGAKIDTVTITGDPTSAQPVTVTLEYMAEKGEAHQVDQPGSDTTLDVVSSDASDTTQTLTIEDEGAGTTEDVSLNGTTTVTTTASFEDIDAIHLDGETVGDITISENSGDDLAVIRGQDSFDFDEGELGVPALGTSSHASAIGSSYEIVQGDTFERPSGTDLADELNTVELTINNNVSEDATTTGARPIVVANERLAEASGTLFGEVEYFDKLIDAVTTTKGNLIWTMDGGALQLDSAVVMTVSGSEEASQGVKEVDVTFEAEGITVT